MMPTHHPDPHPRHVSRNGASTSSGALPYTRADAIADALLFEVPGRLSRLFRFTYQVAVTAQAWFDAVTWDARAEAGKPRPTGQTEAGRITEVLWAARQAVSINGTGTHDVAFTVHRVPPTGPVTRATTLTLQISVHTGDHGETVATIGHRPAPIVGRFHLPDDPRTYWPATGFDRHGNNRFPVVTADTLGSILAAAEIAETGSLCGVDAVPGGGGVMHVHGRDGRTVTVTPDQAGWYHLRTLGWPFICEPDPA